MILSPESFPFRWIEGAEHVGASQAQIREVLDLGKRCVEAGCIEFSRWQGLVGSACKGPHTVAALRELLAVLLLHTRHFPELGAELRLKSEQLAAVLRVPAPTPATG